MFSVQRSTIQNSSNYNTFKIKEDSHYINEDFVQNTGYYNNFKNDLTCLICRGLLNCPSMCSTCETAFCKPCATKLAGKCPMRCEGNMSIGKVSKHLTSIIEKIKICCPNCKQLFSLDKYPSHKDVCIHISCFLCNNATIPKNNLKLHMASVSEETAKGFITQNKEFLDKYVVSKEDKKNLGLKLNACQKENTELKNYKQHSTKEIKFLRDGLLKLKKELKLSNDKSSKLSIDLAKMEQDKKQLSNSYCKDFKKKLDLERSLNDLTAEFIKYTYGGEVEGVENNIKNSNESLLDIKQKESKVANESNIVSVPLIKSEDLVDS